MSGAFDRGGGLTLVPDAASAPFFDGLSAGVLQIQHCGDCATVQLGRLHCEQCGSTKLSWSAASGRGTVYSFVVFHAQYHPAFVPPYVAGVVELEEGPCLYARLAAADVEIGTRVRIDFRPVDDDCPAGFVFVSDGA